ncbi:hypothetical protein G9A89_000539 [Geosiphon pyriformis]|nr:hypothetical protein G9A89_000539 [Geosiphon pyriformis]
MGLKNLNPTTPINNPNPNTDASSPIPIDCNTCSQAPDGGREVGYILVSAYTRLPRTIHKRGVGTNKGPYRISYTTTRHTVSSSQTYPFLVSTTIRLPNTVVPLPNNTMATKVVVESIPMLTKYNEVSDRLSLPNYLYYLPTQYDPQQQEADYCLDDDPWLPTLGGKAQIPYFMINSIAPLTTRDTQNILEPYIQGSCKTSSRQSLYKDGLGIGIPILKSLHKDPSIINPCKQSLNTGAPKPIVPVLLLAHQTPKTITTMPHLFGLGLQAITHKWGPQKGGSQSKGYIPMQDVGYMGLDMTSIPIQSPLGPKTKWGSPSNTPCPRTGIPNHPQPAPLPNPQWACIGLANYRAARTSIAPGAHDLAHMGPSIPPITKHSAHKLRVYGTVSIPNLPGIASIKPNTVDWMAIGATCGREDLYPTAIQ